MPRFLVFCLFATLVACKPNEDSKVKAIIGAVLIDGNGGPPITDSVVVVAGSRIRSAGLRANVPIPAGSDKINGSGKFLTPGLIDLYSGGANSDRDASAGVTTTRTLGAGFGGELTDPDAGRRKVAELAAQRAEFLFMRTGDARIRPEVADAILEESRKYRIPATASVTTLAQAEALVKSGVAGFVGMVGDTEEIDRAFLAKLRALNVVFAPVLRLTPPAERGAAARNTRRMSEAGVPIGVGSGGDSSMLDREMELLVEAGLSPLEVTTAGTRNGALALGKLDQIGTIEAGKRASLLLLNANPLENVVNFRQIDRVMIDGEWK